jgi:hypothetical protein
MTLLFLLLSNERDIEFLLFTRKGKKDRPLFSKEKPAFEANSSIDDLHNYYTLWSLPQAPIYVALWEKRL